MMDAGEGVMNRKVEIYRSYASCYTLATFTADSQWLMTSERLYTSYEAASEAAKLFLETGKLSA